MTINMEDYIMQLVAKMHQVLENADSSLCGR